MKTVFLQQRFAGDRLDQALARQIEELGNLEDGWIGEGSKGAGKAALAWVRDQLVETFPEDLPLPGIALTPEGGLFMEWVKPATRVSLEILLPSHHAEFQAVNLETGESHDSEFVLDTAAAWQAMYALVTKLS